MSRTILFAFLVFAITAANADAFKCEKEGKTVYQSYPCSSGAGETIKLAPAPPSDPLDGAAARSLVKVGMTPAQVRRAWGKPTKINPSFVAGHSHEQWVYQHGPGSAQYVYFTDGRVDGWN